MDWIYDLETYPNCFTLGIVREDGKHTNVLEISDRKNEIDRILDCFRYLITSKSRLVGYNNLGFDYPIIHQMMIDAKKAKKNGVKYSPTSDELYQLAQKQIESFKGEGFGNTIPEKDHIIPQIDLYKIHHFDNKAKATSLKMIEFNMRSRNIEDLPFELGTILTLDEIQELVDYNKNDIFETLKFYKETLPAIKFREELTEKLGKNFINANDTKVGKDYFIMELEKAMPGSCYTQTNYGRKVKQTKRKEIKLGECLFNYYDFHRPEFNAVLNWFKQQTITETKGVFTNIEEHLLGDVAKYAHMKTKRQKFFKKPTESQIAEFKKIHPSGWIEEKELKAPKGAKSYWKYWKVTGKQKTNNIDDDGTLNIVIDGFQFDFGTGGLHGSLNNTIVRSDDEWVIRDEDVKSFYPNLTISNRIYPEHLSERFCDIYEDVYNRRKKYVKGTLENALFKLALNGVYGDSNNQYSPLYDPKYTMSVTINGQLSLCLLVDMLMKEVESFTIVMANTDGISFKVKRVDYDKSQEVCRKWEEITKLELEGVDYSAMYLRDVNNYIAISTDGKIKRKGAYQYEGLGWHQNQSALIIPMAAEASMLYGKDLSSFICSHENEWDFMLRAKVPRSSKLILEKQNGTISRLQNICRYYPSKSKEAGKLVKLMPPLKGKEENGERRLGIDVDYTVIPCNDMNNFKWNIDYSYYINQAKKLMIT